MTTIFDFFQFIYSGNIWVYIIPFLVVLSLLVFVHEWGHYIVARMCGVRVETFSIGFGKEICGRTDKAGTRWKVSLIPLGGYVKMFGDTDPASAGHTDETKDKDGAARPMTKDEKEVAFFAKSVWKRSAIVFAGPAINFLFAILILAGLYAVYGQPVTPPIATAVVHESSADQAGFQPHDKVLQINGKGIARFEDIRREVMVSLDQEMVFTLQRGEREIEITVVPKREIIEDRFGFKHSQGMLGIIGPGSGFVLDSIKAVNGKATNGADDVRAAILGQLDREVTIDLDMGAETDTMTIYPLSDLNQGLKNPDHPDYNHLIVSSQIGEDYVKHGVLDGVGAAVQETWNITASTLTALGQMITGTRSATELGGIIRIGAVAGDMAQMGLIALITFTALLSINLGLINLFPIPMLDGGHLVFYAVEAVKGSPLSEQVQEYAFRVGFAIIVCLMVFANLNDLVQLIL